MGDGEGRYRSSTIPVRYGPDADASRVLVCVLGYLSRFQGDSTEVPGGFWYERDWRSLLAFGCADQRNMWLPYCLALQAKI